MAAEVFTTGSTPYAFTQLDASGNTTDYLNVSNFRDHTMQVKVSSISVNVTFRIEGSLDGTNWFGMDPSLNGQMDTSGNMIATANQMYYMRFADTPLKFIRGNYIAATTGAPAKLDFKYYGR